jgi:hypothetical protein
MKTLVALALSLSLAGAAVAGSPILVGPQGQYLGTWNANRFDPNSVANPYGRYGSRFSPDSVNNPFSRWGSRFSPDSVTNPYATGGGLRGLDGIEGLGDDD